MNAQWIKADGAVEDVQPKSGTFTLAELQGFVSGYVEHVHLRDGRDMWLNEEGKLIGLPVNRFATIIFEQSFGAGTDLICGDVLVCDEEMVE